MSNSLHVCLRPDLSVREVDANTIVLESKPLLRLTNLSSGTKAALTVLISPGACEAELCGIAEQIDQNISGSCRLMYYLLKLRERGLLQYTLRSGTKLLATIESVDDDQQILQSPVPSSRVLVFSRFAYMRRSDTEIVLESPLSQGRIVVNDAECFNVIFCLMRPQTCKELLAGLPTLSRDKVLAFVTLLYSLSVVREIEEDNAGESRYWEFHDMIFHARTRLGQSQRPIGATFRFGLKPPPEPLLKPNPSTQFVKLRRPDIESLIRCDIPFTEVLERRRSLRGHFGRVISADQVGEFLYRVARVRSMRSAEAGGDSYVTDRPYPNAGACYELEIYVLVDRCEGIAGGFYHYRPDSHEVCSIPVEGACLAQIMRDAQVAAAGAFPQALFVLSARFSRVSWKYEGIAYSLILKNVGVLLQTMYLVAAAMRLMPCAIGAGNSRLFAKATGIDALSEASVGEFILAGAEP